MSPPFKTAEFEILYGLGISREGEIIDHGVDLGIVAKSGAWYSYGEHRIGQGKENVREYLLSNPEISKEIEQKVRALLMPTKAAQPEKVTELDAAVGEK